MLSAIASKISPHHPSWARLEAHHPTREKLFYLNTTISVPLSNELDPEFAHAGLLRSPYHDRKMAREFSPLEPSLTILKLRALFGMNAHAEVLSYFADGRKIHASKAARDLGFSQRGIQEILNQMTRGGGMRTFNQGRKKLFQINKNTLGALLPTKHHWKNISNWAELHSQLWSSLHHAESPKPLVLASILRQAKESVVTHLPEFSDSTLSGFKGDDYIQQWYQWHSNLISP